MNNSQGTSHHRSDILLYTMKPAVVMWGDNLVGHILIILLACQGLTKFINEKLTQAPMPSVAEVDVASRPKYLESGRPLLTIYYNSSQDVMGKFRKAYLRRLEKLASLGEFSGVYIRCSHLTALKGTATCTNPSHPSQQERCSLLYLSLKNSRRLSMK